MKERRASQKLSSKSIMDPNQNVKCKIVVVGDSQCGKTALLHVFAKDCFPEVSVIRTSLRGAAGGVPGLEDSVVSPASLIFLKIFLMPSRSLPPHGWKAKVSWKALGWDPPAPSSWPQKLADFSVGDRVGRPGWAPGRGLRVYCVGSVRLLLVVVFKLGAWVFFKCSICGSCF